MDDPNYRKIHNDSKSQIGGAIFAPILIIYFFFYQNVELWFILCGIVTLLLGMFDDKYTLHWSAKLLFQLLLVLFLVNYFFGQISQIKFFHYTLVLSQLELSLLFTIWFVGVYNAVNLIDGLDGLASGFVIIVCITLGILNSNTSFSELNFFVSIILVVFLLFNQRPAHIFMGDAGSLFLGYYCAVLPLLHYDLNHNANSIIDMTPFIILFSFLIADTTRVFFTRILSGKSPMTPDTIHLHHLVLQKSGSYLATLFVIFFTVFFSGVIIILNSIFNFSHIGMLTYLVLLFLFVLTPPAPTYVSIITKIVDPIYKWNKININNNKKPYTLIVFILLSIVLINTFLNVNINSLKVIEILVISISYFILIKINKYKISLVGTTQVLLFLFFAGNYSPDNPGFLMQLFILLLLVTLFVALVKGTSNFRINNFSPLDIIFLLMILSIIVLFIFGFQINIWFFLNAFVIWFGLGFLLAEKKYL
ncbi:MAG: hypothetical protein CMG74_13245 [Candidatus Marinimicrobia bacterium]|nr:hypothetical protein [Candidatus Neomarinimicrobiota bacterium]